MVTNGTSTADAYCQRCGERLYDPVRRLCDVCRAVPDAYEPRRYFEITRPPLPQVPMPTPPAWNIPLEYLNQQEQIVRLKEACRAAFEVLDMDNVEHQGVIKLLNDVLSK